MKNRAVLGALVLVFLPATIFAADVIRAGMWEITTRMEMPGLPMEIPPMTINHCYTKEEVQNEKQLVSTDKNCTVTEFTSFGNRVTWKMKCTGQNPGTFSGETTFARDSYASSMKMLADGAGGIPMTMQAQAKRVGDCP